MRPFRAAADIGIASRYDRDQIMRLSVNLPSLLLLLSIPAVILIDSITESRAVGIVSHSVTGSSQLHQLDGGERTYAAPGGRQTIVKRDEHGFFDDVTTTGAPAGASRLNEASDRRLELFKWFRTRRPLFAWWRTRTRRPWQRPEPDWAPEPKSRPAPGPMLPDTGKQLPYPIGPDAPDDSGDYTVEDYIGYAPREGTDSESLPGQVPPGRHRGREEEIRRADNNNGPRKYMDSYGGDYI